MSSKKMNKEVSEKDVLDALEQSVKHWDYMLTYVRTYYYSKGIVSDKKLKEDCGEWWLDSDCALCELYADEHACGSCPLKVIGDRCDLRASTWQNVRNSKTWGEWAVNAEKMVRVLKNLWYLQEDVVIHKLKVKKEPEDVTDVLEQLDSYSREFMCETVGVTNEGALVLYSIMAYVTEHGGECFMDDLWAWYGRMEEIRGKNKEVRKDE